MRCRVLTWAEEGAILRSGTGLAKTAEDGVVAVAKKVLQPLSNPTRCSQRDAGLSAIYGQDMAT